MTILFRTLAPALLIASLSVPALAHDAGSMPNMNVPGMSMDKMMGVHDMAATVSALDTTTGLVEVTAGGMTLKLHFPAASLANLKVGDSITVHLGFTKLSASISPSALGNCADG